MHSKRPIGRPSKYIISGPRLRHIRESYGVKQSDVAYELGMAVATLSRIESAVSPIPERFSFLEKAPKAHAPLVEAAKKLKGHARFARAYLGIVAQLVVGAPPIRDLFSLLEGMDKEVEDAA